MKKIKNITLILASFLAGIVFIVRCGGDVKTLAEEIAAAVSFDNTATGSSLTSTTVQGAIEELSNTIPFIYDANGNKVGIFQSYDGDYWYIYDTNLKFPVLVEPRIGYSFGDTGELVYATTDCSGTPYFPFGTRSLATVETVGSYTNASISQSTEILYVNDKNYWFKASGSTIKAEDIKSFQTSRYGGVSSTTCFPLSTTLTEPGTISSSSEMTSRDDLSKIIPLYIEAEEITLPTYTGPLNFSKP